MLNSFKKDAQRAFLLVATLAVMPVMASAQVVYDNGLPDNNDGYPVYSGSFMTDNFTLGSATNVAAFRWYALRGGTGGPATITGNYDWKILSDVGGLPGGAVASGSITGGTGTLTSYYCCGAPGSYETYSYDASIGGVGLGSGAYWLAIGNYSAGDWWATSNTRSGNAMQSSDGVTFRPYGAVELAFTISQESVVATPEPASLLLLGTGLLAVGGAARRRSRRTHI